MTIRLWPLSAMNRRPPATCTLPGKRRKVPAPSRSAPRSGAAPAGHACSYAAVSPEVQDRHPAAQIAGDAQRPARVDPGGIARELGTMDEGRIHRGNLWKVTDNRAGGKCNFRGESQPIFPLRGSIHREDWTRGRNPRRPSNLDRCLAESPALL